MDLAKLYVSQRKLRNPQQIPELIKTIQESGYIPYITLSEDVNGKIQVNDGHHRIVAYYLSGRKTLKKTEYILIQNDNPRPTFGKIADLVKRICSELNTS